MRPPPKISSSPPTLRGREGVWARAIRKEREGNQRPAGGNSDRPQLKKEEACARAAGGKINNEEDDLGKFTPARAS